MVVLILQIILWLLFLSGTPVTQTQLFTTEEIASIAKLKLGHNSNSQNWQDIN